MKNTETIVGEGTRGLILYVDDEQGNLDTFEHAFGSDYKVLTTLSGEEALKILKNEDIPMVIADQRMPGMTGIDLCEYLFHEKPETIRIILTAYKEPDLLLNAIHRGRVHDYIVKPWKKSALQPILEKWFAEYRQKKSKLAELESRLSKVRGLEEELESIYNPRDIIGSDAGLKKVMTILKKAAPTDSTMMIMGETGTGKELLARAIHEESKRRSGPFLPVHCAALAKTLLESELFGHEKGAFTGADQMRLGRFEMAHRGTIFLDEISEISEEIQVKLLRVLQEREIERVGGNRVIPIDVRLIAATNRDLKQEVEEGSFREDLYYRLNVIPLKVPPLRERKEDLPSLANYFLQKYSQKTGTKMTLSPEAVEHLARYDWPGNVRELENIIERAVILSNGPVIDVDDLDLHFEEMLQVEKVDVEKLKSLDSLKSRIEEQEIKHLSEALMKTNGNVAEAARLLQLPRTTLARRIKKYQLL